MQSFINNFHCWIFLFLVFYFCELWKKFYAVEISFFFFQLLTSLALGSHGPNLLGRRKGRVRQDRKARGENDDLAIKISVVQIERFDSVVVPEKWNASRARDWITPKLDQLLQGLPSSGSSLRASAKSLFLQKYRFAKKFLRYLPEFRYYFSLGFCSSSTRIRCTPDVNRNEAQLNETLCRKIDKNEIQVSMIINFRAKSTTERRYVEYCRFYKLL